MNHAVIATKQSRRWVLGRGLPAAVLATGILGRGRWVAAQGTPEASGLLAEVRQRGVLRVSNTQASPPWSLLDEKNRPAGYDVDIAREIARRIGVPDVEFIQGTFQNFIPGVQTGTFDIVISGQTVTDERKQQVDFSLPYEVNGVAIFVKSGNETIQDEADLAGKRIGVTAGSTQEDFVRENIPDAEVLTYENATLALRDVALGRADAALFSRFVGAYLAEQNALDVAPMPELLNSEVNAMSFRKGETDFKAAIDRALITMIEDGTLTEISQRWLGGLDMAVELRALPDYAGLLEATPVASPTA
ncbi:MAG: transporter substrate-binding domain-containing protein [Thermomicrobiales bacterium]|nr:transporter substrate-binding domain-containing protein [Thermomicrobiales bacterium]